MALVGVEAGGQGRECEDPPGTGGGMHVMWAWQCGGLEVNRLHSPNSLSLMSTGCRDCWVEEDSEDEREPGSVSSVRWELRGGDRR